MKMTSILNSTRLVASWLPANKLSINAQNNPFMVLHTVYGKLYPVLIIYNTLIENGKQFKLFWHYTLNVAKVVDTVFLKEYISKAIDVIYRLKHMNLDVVLLIIYQLHTVGECLYMYVHLNYSKFSFCAKAWTISKQHKLPCFQI